MSDIQLENKIYIIRDHRVMLDSDLAKLCGVEVKRLIEQVHRNIERFPKDFMFQCNNQELATLRSQIATANNINTWNHKRRTLPYLFTENGVAMLSSVINSKEAIQINIEIMRIFTKLRSFLLLEGNTNKRIDSLEDKTAKIFKIVFQRLEGYEDALKPQLKRNRKKIGFKDSK